MLKYSSFNTLVQNHLLSYKVFPWLLLDLADVEENSGKEPGEHNTI